MNDHNNPMVGNSASVVTISASRGLSLRLGELWEYRELLYFLVWRDIKSRYRQMALGPLWIILKPLLAMVVFTVVFGAMAQIPTNGLPAPVFYYAGLLPWIFFSSAAATSANSLVYNQNLISKVYFPRLFMPLSTALIGVLDFLISFVILLVMMLFYGLMPQWTIVLLPFYLLLAFLAALAIGLWLAAVAVKFRDVTFGIGYLLQLLLYACPIIYPLKSVPEKWRLLYQLNPMANVIEGFRWSMLGEQYGQEPDMMLALSSLVVLAALVSGAFCFKRAERTIVDLI
jgi:lipopolysaccharide transport system permease protein